jgi:5-methylcytosine-specific restriction endonuclease McrA
MTPARKARIHARRKGLCAWCGLPVEMIGPGVVYDHHIPLTLGGADEDDNIRPLHTRPCDKIKTAFDAKVIAKVRRLRANREGKAKSGQSMKSRPFPKDLRRKVNGTVERR